MLTARLCFILCCRFVEWRNYFSPPSGLPWMTENWLWSQVIWWLPQLELPRDFSRHLHPKQSPGALGGYTWSLVFSRLVKLSSLHMTWLRETVGWVERCYHLGNKKTWDGQKKRMNQREKERKSQEKWKSYFQEKKNYYFFLVKVFNPIILWQQSDLWQ